MGIEGSYTVTTNVDGRQVGQQSGLFRDGAGLRALDVYTPARIRVGPFEREVDIEVRVEFDPLVDPRPEAPEPEKVVVVLAEDEPDAAEPDADEQPAEEEKVEAQA